MKSDSLRFDYVPIDPSCMALSSKTVGLSLAEAGILFHTFLWCLTWSSFPADYETAVKMLCRRGPESFSKASWERVKRAFIVDGDRLLPDPEFVYTSKARIRHNTEAVRKSLKEAIFQRDRVCQHCGTDKSLQIDHIVPRIAGGESVAENLQVLCRSCNVKKGIKPDALRASQNERAAFASAPKGVGGGSSSVVGGTYLG